jgi:hypothetical protein
MTATDEWERHRAKMWQVLEDDPLPPDKKRKAVEWAQYMRDRLFGETVQPPASMPAEAVEALEALLADLAARDALFALALKGYERLSAAANALPD